MKRQRRRDLRLCLAALGLTAGFAALHVVAPDVGWLRRLELFALDVHMRVRGPQRPGPETVIVLIDDRTIADLGRWPVPRDRMAQLVDTLRRAGARAIGMDLLFTEPGAAAVPGAIVDQGDATLAQAIAEAHAVVLPFTFRFAGTRATTSPPAELTRAAYAKVRDTGDHRALTLDPTGIVLPVPRLAAVAALGHVMVAYDVDGAPRYDYPVIAYDLDYYPSLAIRVAQSFLGVPWQQVAVELGRGIAIGPVFVPTDPAMRLLVDYLGPARTFPTYSLYDVIAGRVDPAAFAGRVVLVGANALGTGDTFSTPFTAVMPGVERLATLVDSIIHQRHLRRPVGALWAEVGLMLAAAVALGFAMSRLSLVAASACAVALAVALVASGQVALAVYGIWQSTAIPLLALVVTFTALLFYRYGLLDKERRHIRRAFQRYLAPNMVDRLVSDERLPELGGELRELTVLFCDLRGFTALSERLAPAMLTQLANDFFAAATDAVLDHRGTVDKYLGDAIMALWNAPIATPDHAELACRAALRLLQRVDALNASLERNPDMPLLAVGIGINTGVCTVGNFGSARRFDYSAIGDAVNVAARLESETKAYGVAILIGPQTAALIPGFAVLPLDRVELRGRTAALEVFALVGDETVARSDAFIDFEARHARLRDAIDAGDYVAASDIVARLQAEAPPALTAMYAAYAQRIAGSSC